MLFPLWLKRRETGTGWLFYRMSEMFQIPNGLLCSRNENWPDYRVLHTREGKLLSRGNRVEVSAHKMHFTNRRQNCAFQVLCKSWTKRERSWNTAGPPSPTPLWPHPCAARPGHPCSRGSTCTTITSTPTMKTAPLPPGRQCTSRGPLPCISTTLATEQVRDAVSSSTVLDETKTRRCTGWNEVWEVPGDSKRKSLPSLISAVVHALSLWQNPRDRVTCWRKNVQGLAVQGFGSARTCWQLPAKLLISTTEWQRVKGQVKCPRQTDKHKGGLTF